MKEFLMENWGWLTIMLMVTLGGIGNLIDTWIERHYDYKMKQLKSEQKDVED